VLVHFWVTVCKTVRPMLSYRCPVCDVGALWRNGWTDQDETWFAGRPRPWPHCVKWGPSSHCRKGAEPPIFGPYLLRPNGCMDQVATWYRGSPVEFVLDGDPAPSPKRGWSPQIFGSCLLCPNGWMYRDGTWHGGRPQPRRLCVTCGRSPAPQKGGRAPFPIFGHVYCGDTAA